MAHLGGTTAQIQQQIDQNELTTFNNNFYAYTAKECTIYDVLSVVNMAKSFNEQEGYTSADREYFINVTLDGTDAMDLTIKKIDDKIKVSSSEYGSANKRDVFGSFNFELTKYSAEVETSQVTGRVKLIKFTHI